MSKYTSKQYNEVFWKLPSGIRDIVSSYDTTEHLIKIGKKHNLQIDQLGTMTGITLDVIMGIVATKNFVNELVNEVKISPLEASSIVRDIDEEILKPIKETLISLYADGAPNRPSSSLVQYYEEDESHPSLDKDAILSEIEKPVESPVKKEIVAHTVGKLVSEQVSKEISKQIPTNQLTNLPTCPPSTKPAGDDRRANKLDIYHEELQSNASLEGKNLRREESLNGTPKQNQISKIENLDNSSKLLSSQAPKLEPSDLLNKIAGMKLSKTFVMPKASDGVVSKLSGEENTENHNASQPPLILRGGENPNKPTTSATNQLTQAIDPYREKI